MSVAIVKSVVSKFLRDAEPQVLAIRGPWGVGKTYAWKELLKDHKKEIPLKQYSYVSLFGLSSISDLKAAIYQEMVETSLIGQPLTWQAANEQWFDRLKTSARRMAAALRDKQIPLPYGGSISIPFDNIAGRLITECLVCLDDLERTSIDHESLLGFVSMLKEDKHCKVALIFNDQKLEGSRKNIHEKYREKVVDLDVRFAPSTDEVVASAVPEGVLQRELVRECARSLQISNFRVLHKLASLLRLISGACSRVAPQIQERVLSIAVLLTWVHYAEPSERKPPIDFVRTWNALARSMRDQSGNDGPEGREALWAQVLKSYGFFYMDDLEHAVDRVIMQGYLEGSRLEEELRKAQEAQQHSETRDQLTRAWRLFHGTFANNGDVLIPAFIRTFREGVMTYSPGDLNGVVTLLRDLSDSQDADDLIEFYVAQRGGQPELFDLSSLNFLGPIDDVLRRRFNEVATARQALPSLYDAVLRSAADKGWSKELGQVLDEATEDDIYQIFTDPNRADITDFLKALMWHTTIQGREEMRVKAMSALRRVAALSPLNALRVRKYGIRPAPAEAPPANKPSA